MGARHIEFLAMACAFFQFYSQASDLTNFGKDVELDPNYGIAVLAKRASIFSK
jgi:hypothetical protein